MSEPPADAAAPVRVPPPLLYLLATVVGALAQRYAWPLPPVLGGPLKAALAALLAVAGGALMLGALGRFRATGQDPKPWKPSPEIVAGGVYGYTRNPMYLAMALLQGAIGVGLANAWILFLVPLSLVVVYLTAVRHEEAYLESKFGEAYLEYKRSVRRWV